MQKVTVLLASVCVACGTVLSAVDSERQLVARVTGAVVSDFKGTATYLVAQNQPTTGYLNLTILATTEAPAGREAVLIIWVGRAPPTRGDYEVLTAPPSPGTMNGFYALYHSPPTTSESFVSQGGRLTIVELDDNHIAGSFKFTAKRYCQAGTVGLGGDCVPSTVAPGAPEVTLEGSFAASAGRPRS